MNIVVLYGGLGTERDVSISSGTKIALALAERGHKVVPIDLYLGYTGSPYKHPEDVFSMNHDIAHINVAADVPDLETIKNSREQPNDSIMGDNVIPICRCADIVFLALHGDEGENGKIQAALDVAGGIKYTGSGYIGSALAMNKGLSKKLFSCAGIKTPRGVTLRPGEALDGRVGFPCVVKPNSGGSSVGTSIVERPQDFDKALEDAFRFEDLVIVEDYIKGRELTVGVLGGKAMPVIEIIPKAGFYDYKNKYQPGFTEEICPAPISPEDTKRVQALAEKASQELMTEGYSRADFLMDEKGDIYCLEVNTLPGMTPTSLVPQMGAVMGYSYGELCEKLIEISLEKYK